MKITIPVLLIIWLTPSMGFCQVKKQKQKNELRVELSIGSFHYSVRDMSDPLYSLLYAIPTAAGYAKHSAFPNNPWGNKAGFSFGASLDIRHRTREDFFYGVDLGFESLETSKELRSIYDGTTTMASTGTSTSRNTFINGYPNIGYRLKFGEVDCNIMTGVDFAFIVVYYQNNQATAIGTNNTAEGTVTSTSAEGANVTDWRWRSQIELEYHKVGLLTGYSLGFFNGIRPNDTENARSRYWRIGLTYRVN